MLILGRQQPVGLFQKGAMSLADVNKALKRGPYKRLKQRAGQKERMMPVSTPTGDSKKKKDKAAGIKIGF